MKDLFVEIVLQTLLDCRQRGFYLLHDFVVMPDHIHLILTTTADTSLEKAVQMIKGGSSHRIGQTRQHSVPVWQKGFHEHWVRSEDDYQARKHYIEWNPVKAGLASTPQQYPYSSASGRFPLDPFSMTSAAKAAVGVESGTAGLKPRP
ncbi:MAG TPA: transposase, partial [Candidatus Xenobia bacterium]|nr:transposase [Candidatus Xenobia bacterium]